MVNYTNMIREQSKKRILELWKSRNADLSYPPASEQQIEEFENECLKIPEDYRWFLLNCGGGLVASEWVDAIDELYATHIRFNQECTEGKSWTISDCFVIGWDSSGSPIAIDKGGNIVVQWEADREIYQLASSLESWLLDSLIPSNG